MPTITAQRKKEIVLKVINGNEKVAKIARENFIARKTVYSWVKIYKENIDKSPEIFEPHYVKGKSHPKAKYPQIEKGLLLKVAKSPTAPINILANNLPVSVWTVWNILSKHNLTTKEQRIAFAENYKRQILTNYQKQEIVLRIIEGKERVARVAREYGIARKTIYSWLKRYKENVGSPEVFDPRYVKGKNHPKAIYPDIEKRLLGLVAENPSLSINLLAKSISVSVWTVWNLLDKYNLNTKKQRFEFAEEITRREEETPLVYSPVMSFDYISHQVELLLALTRKIPRFISSESVSSLQKLLFFLQDNISKIGFIFTELIKSVLMFFYFVINHITKYFDIFISRFQNSETETTFSENDYKETFNGSRLLPLRERIGYLYGLLAFEIDKTERDIGNFIFELFGFAKDNQRFLFYYTPIYLMVVLSFITLSHGTIQFQKTENDSKTKVMFSLEVEKNNEENFKGTNNNFRVSNQILTVSGNNNYNVYDQPSFTIQKRFGVMETAPKEPKDVLGAKVENQPPPNVSVTDSSGNGIGGIELSEGTNGDYEITVKQSDELKPGKYTLNVQDENGVEVTQTFNWGVLAINTDKSIYQQGELVRFVMTALDANGKPFCNANLVLKIINENSNRVSLLTTADGGIAVNPECASYSRTNKGDYETSYVTSEAGRYNVELLAEVSSDIYTAKSGFDVLETQTVQDFEVARGAPVRVGPGQEYPVILEVKANKDYQGVVTDRVPKNFLVKPFGTAIPEAENNLGSLPEVSFVTKVNGNDQNLSWNVDFKKGNIYKLAYSFSDFGNSWTDYYLGPVIIGEESVGERWELRPDLNMPVGNVIEGSRYKNLKIEDKILRLRSRDVTVSLAKAYYKIQEDPVIKITSGLVNEPTPTTGVSQRVLGLTDTVASEISNNKINISVKDGNGNIEYEINIDNFSVTSDIDIPSDKLKPGKHIVTISDSDTGNFVQQEFVYGVLALNINKSVYEKDESAYLQMASLNQSGSTDCFSNLELGIFSPSGKSYFFSVAGGTINLSTACGANNVTDDPDYFINFPLSETGDYRMILTNLEYGFSVDDTFKVTDASPISLERKAATRINPFKSRYVMKFNITADENFSGTLSEQVPKDFEISDSPNYSISSDGNYQYVIWQVDVARGENREVSYEYQAPKISPEVYLLGQAEIKKEAEIVFSENRYWQLASDAPNTPTYKAAGTYTAGMASITPPYPTGGSAPVAGDIALLIVESENQTISLTTANGFSEVGTQANKAAGTAGVNPASRLAVYWKRCTGGDLAPVVADSGDHQTAQILLFSGVRSTGNPWDVIGEGNDSAANDTSGIILGATTTIANTLVVLISSTSYNGTSTAEFANIGATGGWANANLTSLTEIVDQSNTIQSGGGFGVATGIKASASAIGNTTVTLSNTSYKGAMSIALAGSEAPTLSISQPDGSGDSVNNTGGTYNITYSLSDTDDVVTAAFYYDSNNSGLDGTPILGACATAAEGTNTTCSWDANGMVPGEYYIYGVTTDTINTVSTYSSGTITVTGSSPLNTPTFKAAGTFTAGTAAITPPYPTGGNAPAADDIAILVVTSENESISLSTANGFSEIGAQANKAAGSAATDPGTRLAVYWKRCTGGDLAPVIADSGNNTEARIYLFSGVRRSGNPWDIYGEGNDSAANDTSGVIPDATTTVANTLVLLISSTSYNGTSTAEFADVGTTGGWTNSNLLSVTEINDNTDTSGLGGGHGFATATKPTPGSIGTTTVTLANTSYKGAMTIALAGKYPSTLSLSQPDGVGDIIAPNVSYNVTYTLADSDIVATAAFYYDTNNSGFDGVAITGACATAPEGTGATCAWNTTGVSSGTYYIYGITNDGVNSQVSTYSSGAVTINAAPTVNLDQPDGVNDTITEGSNFTVQYDLSDTDNVVTGNFYYDTNNSGYDGTVISGCQNQVEATNATCTWNTTGVLPGTYYVYGIVNDGINLQVNSYSSGAVTINRAPEVNNVSLNGGANINLTADSRKNINFTANVTDANGPGDIQSVIGKMYRSGVGQSCSDNDNSCYSVASCTVSNCVGNTCTATCTASVAFFADATDTGTYSSEYWLAWIKAFDNASATDEDYSPISTTDVNSLLTISTTSGISYGSLSRGANSAEKTTTVTNAGNRLIDIRISGNTMCSDYPTCSGYTIANNYQEYSLSSFTYGNGSDLSGSPTDVDINIAKSSAVPSNSTANVYWILGVPLTASPVAYSGSNTITSIISP